MYIIYRIIKKQSSYYNNIIIAQDVMEVDKKEDFKEAIKLLYGDDIKFKNNKNVQDGDLFVSIISYDCHHPEDYLLTINLKCDECNKDFIATSKQNYKFNDYYINRLKSINQTMYAKYEKELSNKVFCSKECLIKSYDKYLKMFEENAIEKDGFVNCWVTRESAIDDSGFIYMITKKSTGEFYVGKTNALPMFRWIQHLKTDRFTIDNITDYKFEILEHCKDKLADKETHWINIKRNENPDKCLNIIVPKEKMQLDLLEE